MKTIFDGSRPKGSRVISVSVRCIDCSVPRYRPLEPEKYYRVITTDFIGAGGGNYTVRIVLCLDKNVRGFYGLVLYFGFII